jgi:hypothetical protein
LSCEIVIEILGTKNFIFRDTHSGRRL